MVDDESPQVVTMAIIKCNLYGGMNYLFNLEFNLLTCFQSFSLGLVQLNSILLYTCIISHQIVSNGVKTAILHSNRSIYKRSRYKN